MDNHPPQRAVLPPGTPPVGTQDPPHQARGAFQDSLPLQPVSLGFSLELFLDSELMAGLPAQGNRERPSGLKLRPFPGPASLSCWLCPLMTPGAVEAQSSRRP